MNNVAHPKHLLSALCGAPPGSREVGRYMLVGELSLTHRVAVHKVERHWVGDATGKVNTIGVSIH